MQFVSRSLVFQRDDLGLCQHNTFFGDLLLQGLEAQLTTLQGMAQPDTAGPAGRHESTLFAQLITDSELVMRGVVQCKFEYSLLYDCLLYTSDAADEYNPV